MKKINILIIAFIIFILIGSIILFDLKRYYYSLNAEIFEETVKINKLKIDVTYDESNKLDNKISYGNKVSKKIKINNKNKENVVFSLILDNLNVSNDLVTYDVFIKDKETDKYIALFENEILKKDKKLAYNIVVEENNILEIKVSFKANYEKEKTSIKGNLRVVNNLNEQELFIENINTIQNNLLKKIDSLNGINEKGFYILDVKDLTEEDINGYILIDARDISELKYIYTIYNGHYMVYNLDIVNLKKSKVTKKDTNKINELDFNKVCSLYTKKKCLDFNKIKYSTNGGKKNFITPINGIIESVKKINDIKSDKVIIYNVVDDIKNNSNIKGYILVNNKLDTPEYYLYINNGLFMISGYNLTKLGMFDESSSTIRAYNETSFELSSKDYKTVCSFSGFSECFKKDGTLIK